MTKTYIKAFARRCGLFFAALAVSVGATIGMAFVTHAADCDDNAVIKCGVTAATIASAYQKNQGGNVKDLYKYFGINGSDDLTGLVAGKVTTENKVYVGNQVVATNVVSAGRQKLDGGTAILGGRFYQRPPSVGFANGTSSLPALVKLDANGKFLFAIIESCGNPVKGTPVLPPKPDFTLEKQVSTSGQNNWQKNVQIAPGASAWFRIILKNTGETDLTHITVRDQLPAGLSFVAGSVTIGGAANNGNITNSIDVASLKKGAQLIIIFKAVASQNSGASTATCSMLTNTAFASTGKLPEKKDTATVQICTQPVPAQPEQPKSQVLAAVTPTEMPKTGNSAGATVAGFASVIGFTAASYVFRRVKYGV